MKDKKVALVHDFLVCRGGAEKVLQTLSEMFPEAPIYTLLYDKDAMRGMFADRDIRPSFLQKFPRFLRKRYRFLLPFFPVAVEAFDLRDFDVVISSSGAWSKGIVTRLDTKHIAYIHSPMRYVWDYNEQYLRETGGGHFNIFKRMLLSYLRVWDREAADRPDFLVANSVYTQSRIAKYYRHKSVVIYPPIACHPELPPERTISVRAGVSGSRTNEANPEREGMLKQPARNATHNVAGGVQHDGSASFFGFKSKEYFLVVSRLTPNKKVELVVEAFNKLGLPLIVVGEGKQKQHLIHIAKPKIKIVGWQDDDRVAHLYTNARALIFPAEDDFGMVMVEAMLHSVPVIAYAEGGAKEIVREGVTGEFFRAQTPEIMADGVRRFLENEGNYDAKIILESAKRFSREQFEHDMHNAIQLALK